MHGQHNDGCAVFLRLVNVNKTEKSELKILKNGPKYKIDLNFIESRQQVW